MLPSRAGARRGSSAPGLVPELRCRAARGGRRPGPGAALPVPCAPHPAPRAASSRVRSPRLGSNTESWEEDARMLFSLDRF